MSAALLHFINKGLVNRERFDSSGTFNVPDGVQFVYLEGCGGGGGGAGTITAFNPASGGGGVGTARWVGVVPGASVSVTIGSGGAGGTSTDGSDGGNSSFGSLIFPGGGGGLISGQGFQTIPGFGNAPGSPPISGTPGGNIYSFWLNNHRGGEFDSQNGSILAGGGAGFFGPGGDGNASGTGQAGQGRGSGGGAGGGVSGTGGAGANGRIDVYWIEPV